MGVAAANASSESVLIAGVAGGLVAGAMSMAAGEYVSVSSQADTERADLDPERSELVADPDY
jgi:VIT1/CCC1 family predicted Fe2+/Mn2+ transporter